MLLILDVASCEADIAFFAARHDAGTRQWLFDDFDNWFSDPGDSRAYVLLGDAGVGKSVMAGVLAQRTRKAGHLGAAYFCRHNDGTRNDPRYLLGTVACQLCDCNSQYSNIVGGEGGVRMMLANSKLGVQELFTKLLEEPLVKCNPCQQRKLVIIDALDETEYESREDFLDLMKERFPRLPKWLVFFITSRPEDTVQSRLERYNPCVRICAGNSEQRHFYRQHEQDIRHYLKKRIDFSSVPYSVEDITNKCNGLFLYAFYIQKELGVPGHSGKSDQLSDLFPGDIDDFFRENFQRMYDKVGADLYKKLIGCVIAAPSPLPVSFIPFVVNKEKAALDEQEVIDAVLHFSLYQTSDDSVTFLHKLIPTWLTKNQVESKNQRKTKRKRKDCPHLLIDRKAAGEYLRTLCVEILPAVVGNRSPEFPSADVDLQDYVLRVAVRFLCQLGDIDALKDVFSCLTSYHFLEKRIKNGRTEIYHLLEDFKLAAACSTFQDTEKLNIVQEISVALERNVHVLLECPHLLHSCLLDGSNAVQESILIRENVVTQVSAPWLEWNVCDLPSIECLSGFNVFATASDKKTVAAANGRSLLFFDASTLKIVAGPFELNQGEIEEINHLEFSPNDKFVFFGRLDKWFSVEKECVEDLPEFSKNSIIYEWGLFTPDGRCIVVKRNDFFHIPQTCQGKCCMVELLALWAVKEMDRSKDDERTCFFGSLRTPFGAVESTKGGPTERLLERLQIDPNLHKIRHTSVPYDPTCYFCCRFQDLIDLNQEPSLAAVRQLIIELYPHIFQYQVWNFQTGRPLLQDALHPGIQLNLFTYFCHVCGAFDEWGKQVGCSGIEKVVSVCNTAVVNAVYAIWKLTLFLDLNHLQESQLRWIKRIEREVAQWQREYLRQVQKRKGEWKQELVQEVESKQMHTQDLLQELKEVRDFERLEELRNELKMELGQSWGFKPLYWAVETRVNELELELELEKTRWRISAPTWLFRDSLTCNICGDFPKGFQDLFGADSSLCVSPRNKWVAEGGKDSQAIDLFQTTRHEEQLEHKIAHVERFTFTNDDLYVVYLSSEGSLHALSLQTGTLFTSVSGPNLLHFTRERQFGYLFRSGSEEKTIFLTNLFRPFKFLSVLPIKTSVVSKSIAAIFTSSDTVVSINSDLTVALWNTSNVTKGFAFKFISGSSLTNPCSHVLHDKNGVLSPNGKLVACHQGTKIEIHRLAESGKFHDTVIDADSGITNVCLTFSADSSLLLSYIQDSFNRQHFYVWDVQKKAISASFKSPGLLTVECFCISWDNRNLILCGEYEIEIWEYNQRPCRLLRRIIVEEPYQSVKFCQCAVSSDNELLFCCVANIIILFSLRVPDVHSSKRILRGHLGRIEFCKFLKVSRYLISYGVDGMVFLWDLIKTKAVGFVRVAQGQEYIVTAAVSPEDSRVVCFTSSGRVCEIKLCKLKDAPSSKLLTSRIKSKVNSIETVRQQLAGGMALTSKNPVQSVEDEAYSSPDSEEDMHVYYLEHDDVDEFD